jgi:transcriptional repressor NrdR
LGLNPSYPQKISPKDEGYEPVIHRAKPTVIHTTFDWSKALFCPFCRHSDSRVVDSRATDDGSAIRRRRQCPECDRRFTTIEVATLSVVKRSGVIEPFSRAKVVNGLRKACQGRPVTDDDLALLAQKVEEAVRASGAAAVDSHEVGLATLSPLRELDEVAYLRFASVYRSYESLEDFEAEISLLRTARELGDVSVAIATNGDKSVEDGSEK